MKWTLEKKEAALGRVGEAWVVVWEQAEGPGRAGESNQRLLRWRQALGGFGTRLEKLERL